MSKKVGGHKIDVTVKESCTGSNNCPVSIQNTYLNRGFAPKCNVNTLIDRLTSAVTRQFGRLRCLE